MADEESPRPFRRERNLSNRNFNKRGSRRRISTESHSSVESASQDSYTTLATSAAASATVSATAGPTTTASTARNTSDVYASANANSISSTDSSSTPSSLFKLLHSMNSNGQKQCALNQRSLLNMVAASEEVIVDAPTTPDDPALLGVKQKVLRFETLQADERVLLQSSAYKIKSLHKLDGVQVHDDNRKVHFSPLRVLPILKRNDSSKSALSSASFHTSIDEARSEDEVDKFSDCTEDDYTGNGSAAVLGGEYFLPEVATELKEGAAPSPIPNYPIECSATELNGNVAVLSYDDFGKVESVRRTTSTDSGTEQRKVVSEMRLIDSSGQTSPVAVANKTVNKDFPRNFRSTPRPKTELMGITNTQVVNKFNSVYHPKDEEEEEEEIELRSKCDKHVQPILDELIKTEETYVENLVMGIKNYGNIFQRKDLPIGLRGKKYVLLGNIEQIAEFHRDEFLPMLHRHRRDLKRIFDEFQHFVDQHCFYSYVIFTMNKQRSLKLCDAYKNYFKVIQVELDDKLGINSFLVQPIQRMARYPLLLTQFIEKFFKNRDYVMKPLIESCCRLEKKVRTLLVTTNESEVINDIVDCNEFNVFYQGKFRKVSEFNVTDHTQKRSYRSKVFIFDKCIIYTEINRKQLVFRGRYPCEHIGFTSKSKSFTLFYERRKQQECDFAADPALIEMWIELIRDMISSYATEERLKLQERYSRDSDHMHRKPHSLSLFRDSNRFSSDSGIGNIWVMPKPEVDEELIGNRTTWYAAPLSAKFNEIK